MAWDAWLTLAVVAGAVYVLARDLVPPAATLLGATIVLLVARVIDAEQAFAGFSNPAPITVAALYVLARAVGVTGALEPVIARVMGAGGDDTGEQTAGRGRLLRLLAPTAAASAFLNNTPVVAMAAPQVSAWATQRGRSPAPLLMPLSFAAILGGLVTAIGTSTNLVVSGFLEETGEPALGMFEITLVGLPVAVVGIGLLVLLAPYLAPKGRGAEEVLQASVRQFSVAMRVDAGGALDGVTVEDAGLRHLQGVYLVQVDRGGQVLAPVGPDQVLTGGDVLTFVGKVDQVVDLQRKRGLSSTEEVHLGAVKDTRQAFFEAVLGPGSQLVGSTLRDVGFRGRYGAAVLAIHRAGQRVEEKLGTVPLRAGDTLLLLADRSFYERWRESQDFLLVASLSGTPPARTRKAPLVAGITVALVALAGVGVVPILEAALVAAVALVGLGVLTVREARDAVDLNVIVVIAAAFALGAAMMTTGLADQLASLLVAGFEPLGALGALAGVMVATVLLTELITNNAAAVLMFPIAVSTAAQIDAQPRGFAIAVAVAASASFLTPVGYQTNTMVYGLGGYRFLDYPRLGLPLTAAVVAVTLVVIPLGWPL